MTRQDHVLRTTTLERMLLALVLTTLAIGARPSSADSLKLNFGILDKPAWYKAEGNVMAQDEAPVAPKGGFNESARLGKPLPTTNWYFTLRLAVKRWEEPGFNKGARGLTISIEGVHKRGPHQVDPTKDNPNNVLPKVTSAKVNIDFGASGSLVAQHESWRHWAGPEKHYDRYAFVMWPKVFKGDPFNNKPHRIGGTGKVLAVHSGHSRPQFPEGEDITISLRPEDETTVTYDADTAQLTFNLGPIVGLDREGGDTGGSDLEYTDDPILAGEVSVTALEFLGQDDDGRYLFGGGEIEIIDPAEQFVFRASFSEYVLDPTALPEEPTGLAWVESLGISDIPDDQDAPSQFLRDYVERAMFGEDMPTERSKRLLGTILSVETILDLVVLTEGFTQSAFDIPATVQIGAAFSPPCQCQGDVNQDGIVDDVDVELVLGCQGAEPEEECEAADINCDDVIDEQDIEAVLCLVEGDDALDCCAAESESAWEDDANGDDNVDPLDSGFGPARFGDWP